MDLFLLLDKLPFNHDNPDVVEHHLSVWLSLPDTALLVKSLIDDAKADVSLIAVGSSNIKNASAIPSPSMLPAGVTPPSLTTPSKLKSTNEPVIEVIPQFYFKHGRPLPADIKEHLLSRIHQYFHDHSDRLSVEDFRTVTKEICKLPSFFCGTLFKRIDTECVGIITRDVFIEFWVNSSIMTMDKATQMYRILKQADQDCLTQADIKPIIEELVATHPYFKTLHKRPFYHEKYVETVIYRIFFYVNRAGNGCLTLRELKRGNLIGVLYEVDVEKDINNVLRYFSFQHFIVIYSKFTELDRYDNFRIRLFDLMKYGNNALSFRIVERIFKEIPRKLTCPFERCMGYEDFVYFILAEEDKSSEPSLEYWFKCINLSGNGGITAEELQYFYTDQRRRMISRMEDPLPFEDILCQIIDMICPENGHFLTLRDFKSSKLSGNVFDMLFSLNKYMAFDNCEGSSIKLERETEMHIQTEWDRFARREHLKMLSGDR